MDIYKQAVWNELRETMKLWDAMVDALQRNEAVDKATFDRTRHKINGLMSQLDQKAA